MTESSSSSNNTIMDTTITQEQTSMESNEESSKLRLELQSAKEEIERLARELQEEKKRNAVAVLAESSSRRDDQEATVGSINDEADESSDSEDESEEEESVDEDIAAEEAAASPISAADDDIRLRAARTLIWANSAMKRASITPSEEGGCFVPTTVHVPESSSSSSVSHASGLGDDSGSLLSYESSSGKRRAGPIAAIRHFVHEAVEDVKETVADVKDLVAESRTPEPKMPVTSPSFKYCNDAFKKLADDSSSTVQDSSVASSQTPSCNEAVGQRMANESSQPATPLCNPAMMKLNQKQKRGFMNRLFQG